MDHYSFFQNKHCEYFPCHQTDDIRNFNCLFCYCPLYCLGPGCEGDYSYTEHGIKDCSGCAFPHHRENYLKIISRFPEIQKIAEEG